MQGIQGNTGEYRGIQQNKREHSSIGVWIGHRADPVVDTVVLHHVLHHLGREVRPPVRGAAHRHPVVLAQPCQELCNIKPGGAHKDTWPPCVSVHEHTELVAVQGRVLFSS